MRSVINVNRTRSDSIKLLAVNYVTVIHWELNAVIYNAT